MAGLDQDPHTPTDDSIYTSREYCAAGRALESRLACVDAIQARNDAKRAKRAAEGAGQSTADEPAGDEAAGERPA